MPEGAGALRVGPVTRRREGRVALAAWRRFGKGRHPAGLNLGDCYAYAVAKCSGAPLLFKGQGFTQTDVASAL